MQRYVIAFKFILQWIVLANKVVVSVHRGVEFAASSTKDGHKTLQSYGTFRISFKMNVSPNSKGAIYIQIYFLKYPPAS